MRFLQFRHPTNITAHTPGKYFSCNLVTYTPLRPHSCPVGPRFSLYHHLTMHPTTSQALLSEFERLCSWDGSLIFLTSHGNVNLIDGIGPMARCLSDLPMQPLCYPKGTSYLFDPTVYLGLDAADALMERIIANLHGSSMYKRGNNVSETRGSTTFRICCSFTCSADGADAAKFDPNKFTKTGVRKANEKLKQSSKNTAYDRMPDHKLRDTEKKSRVTH